MDKAGLKRDAPQPFGDYLGCGQAPITLTKEQAKERLQHIDPIRIGSGGCGEPDGSADRKEESPNSSDPLRHDWIPCSVY